MIRIYSKYITQRLFYVLDIIFNDILNTEYLLTDNPNGKIDINYSDIFLSSSLNIFPTGLLFEDNVRKIDIKDTDWLGRFAFFSEKQGDIPFDIFSAIFYLLSRYEEYSVYGFDKLGRFMAEKSLAYEANFLNFPIVNFWIENLAGILGIDYSKSFIFKPTFDIDIAYKYLCRGMLRTSAGLFRSLLTFNLKDIKNRLGTISGKVDDPFNVYEKILLKIKDKSPVFFVLVRYGRKFDKAVSVSCKRFVSLLEYLSDTAEIALHPSVKASADKKIFGNELDTLKHLNSGFEIYSVRMHYLMIKFPDTYRLMIENGIKHDYSLGYPDYPGFRASFTYPFYFFDLLRNKKTNLILHPLPFMDATYEYYKNISENEIISDLKNLLSLFVRFGGEFAPLFHNDLLATERYFMIFSELLQKIEDYEHNIIRK